MVKKNCLRLSALVLSTLLIIAALPIIAVAETVEIKSPFSNLTCIYDRSSAKIKLEYRMKSEDVKKYADCKIELYALSASQTIADIPNLEPKCTDLSPSNRASAEFRYKGLHDRLSSYVFVMKTDDGLICSDPILPQVDSSQLDIPFKGIETSSTALTVGTTAETVLLDIDTDSLISTSQGYLYPTTDYTYTFSSTYLKRIDDLITLYRGAGRKILFRLVFGPNTFGAVSQEYELQRTVYSCVSFLYSRYDTERFGGINGFVIGTAEQNTPESAARYSYMLYAAAAGLDDLDAYCPLIVPVGENLSKTTAFLDAMLAELGESPKFSLMLESHHAPYSIDDSYISEFDENADATSLLRPSNSSSEYISAENLTRLTRQVSQKYKSSVYPNIIYHWTPGDNVTGDAAIAAYVYNYYALSQSGQTVSFILSPGEQMEREFIDAVKYINTNLSTDAIDHERILKLFDLDSWENHFSRYDPEKLKNITVKNIRIQSDSLPRFIGTVDYFDFSSSIDISGWYAGQNCSSIYSDSTELGKSFNARLSFPAEHVPGAAFVSYTYRYSESFKYTDYIAIELSVESTNDESYDVTVSIGGAGFIYEYTAKDIPAGSRRTLYLDVREFDESMVTDFLRVTVEPQKGEPESARLSLYSVTANSMTYDSTQLKAYILAERERLKSDGAAVKSDDISRNAIVFLVAILIVTVFVMITISRRRRKKRLNGEDNE